MHVRTSLLPALLFTALAAAATDWKAGVARANITPDGPMWLSGYASRDKPASEMESPLWAKALAIEDRSGGRIVLVSTDLIGLPRALSEQVAAECSKQFGLERSRIVLNSSHTHSGPVVRANLSTMYNLNAENQRRVEDYSNRLAATLVRIIGESLANLKPAAISFGEGKAGFAANRREFTPQGVRIGVNPNGPVDHSVPVVKVVDESGKLQAVLFGYACHNTTLTGEFYKFSGDYAGHAQAELERLNPGITALFYELCGGDQNPNPRSRLELAEAHGKTLAAEVHRVLATNLTPVRGRVRTSFQVVDLPLAPHKRETFEEDLKSTNVFRARRAREILKAYDERREPRKVPYPVQVVRIPKGFTLIALGGEVVVGYALWAKQQFRGEPLIVAGYSNDVMCYIPTAKILEEGGYEAVDSMIYYGLPGPFHPEVEERLQDAIRRAMKRAGW